MSDIKDLQRQIAALTQSIGKMAGEQEIVLFTPYALKKLSEKLNNPTLRKATKASFENQVERHLVPAFGHLALDKVTNPVWLEWVTYTRKTKPNTRFFNARKTLTEILRAAKNDDLLVKLPSFDNPDEAKDVGRALSDCEVLRILRHMKSDLFRFFFILSGKWDADPRRRFAGNGL